METIWLKVHLGFLGVSIVLFLGRSALSFAGSSMANHKLALVGTLGSMALVLLSAAILAMKGDAQTGWLIEKGIGLVLYVVFALLALKPGTTTGPRFAFMGLALAAFVSTFMLAKAHMTYFL